jgi:hypothetical protein
MESEDMSDFEEILARHRDGDFKMFAAGEDAPPVEVIEAFEKTLGYELPPDFRDFSTSWLGGLYIEAKEEVWPRAKPYDVGPFWSFLYGMMVYGFGEDIPEWMDMRLETPKFQQETGVSHVPFLKIIGDADVYCFTAQQSIVRWDHETGEFTPIDGSFTEILDIELGKLRERKDRKKAGNGA